MLHLPTDSRFELGGLPLVVASGVAVTISSSSARRRLSSGTGPSQAILDGQRLSRIFDVRGSLSLENVQLVNGWAEEGGAILVHSGGSVTLSATTITHSTAYGVTSPLMPGGIRMEDGTGFRAPRGGAISIASGGTAALRDGTSIAHCNVHAIRLEIGPQDVLLATSRSAGGGCIHVDAGATSSMERVLLSNCSVFADGSTVAVHVHGSERMPPPAQLSNAAIAALRRWEAPSSWAAAFKRLPFRCKALSTYRSPLSRTAPYTPPLQPSSTRPFHPFRCPLTSIACSLQVATDSGDATGVAGGGAIAVMDQQELNMQSATVANCSVSHTRIVNPATSYRYSSVAVRPLRTVALRYHPASQTAPPARP